ncbi:ABC transporter permease [Puniceicoccus vermicola]|uniref:ABC transporter permease n=1 Tax=Puniceicoccus vermicola TaxID=388746 RepID=A0A7X1B000_9BACT|nr:ABC transporter permease [Puniceicoccus vermicola]MBC2603059.1 ABC transporter permease [Puniceicoccus vermicola]
MRNFINFLRHEIRVILFSPSSYVAGVLFLLLMGLIYWAILKSFTLAPQEDTPATQFFRVFWIPAFFVVPLLTMRSVAEERRLGTLQTLLTTPTGPVVVVLAKFCAIYLFYLFLWSCTIAFPLLASEMTSVDQARTILFDPASLLGGYLFVALSGTLFIALGIFCSSLTRSQLVAGMLCFTGLFLLIAGSRLLLEVPLPETGPVGSLNSLFQYLQTFEHLLDFSAGIIDSRPFVYYLSGSIFFLIFSVILVERKA